MHLATDWRPYAEHMMDVLSATEALEMWPVTDSFLLGPSPGLKPSLNAEAIVWGTGSGTYCSPNARTLLEKYCLTTAPLLKAPSNSLIGVPIKCLTQR